MVQIDEDPGPFEVLGLAPSIAVDTDDARKRLRRFTRLVHPDFFALAGEDQVALAEAAGARLNAAHDLVVDFSARADWLVRHLGGPSEKELGAMPQAFLMEVMEWNEVLEENALGSPCLAALASELEEHRTASSGPCGALTPSPPPATTPSAPCARTSTPCATWTAPSPAPPARRPPSDSLRPDCDPVGYIELDVLDSSPKRVVIGIDLGTTNSLPAIWKDGRPEVLRIEGEAALVPSVVHVKDDGTAIVGRSARARSLDDPAHTVHSVKRFMGRSLSDIDDADLARLPYGVSETDRGLVQIEVRGKRFSPQELSAILRAA